MIVESLTEPPTENFCFIFFASNLISGFLIFSNPSIMIVGLPFLFSYLQIKGLD